MILTKRLLYILLLMLLLCCSGGPKNPNRNSRVVYTGIPPIAYLAEKIAGPSITVEVLLRTGQSPHTFEPTPSQISGLSQARLYLAIGFPFEQTLLQNLPQDQMGVQIFDCDTNIERIRSDEAPDHDNHEHEHEGLESDPHIWMSPGNAKQIALNIYAALVETYPDNFGEFSENLWSLVDSLELIDSTIAELLRPYKGESIYVYHPAFGYFTQAYGLYQESVEIEGKSPSPRQIEELIEKARRNHVEILFVQPQFDTRSAQVIAEAIGGTVVQVDPLERNLLQNFIHIAEQIEISLNQFK